MIETDLIVAQDWEMEVIFNRSISHSLVVIFPVAEIATHYLAKLVWLKIYAKITKMEHIIFPL